MAAKPRAPRTRRQKAFHIVRQSLIAVILLVVLPGIYFYLSRTDHAPSVTEATLPEEPLAVSVMVVQPHDVEMDSRFLAQTEASQEVPIRARVTGFLQERTFEEGQRVEKDQVLFRIDPEPFEVALAQATAQQAAAQARLQRAEQQLQRVERLVAQSAASDDELEQLQEEQQVATAEVRLQQARIAQAQLDLDYTTIRSPLTGMIGESRQDVGTYINPMTDSLLATVQQVDPLYVRYSVSEQELLRWQRMVEEGAIADVAVEQMEVELELPDGRIHPHRGQINFVDVAVDPSTGTAVVRAAVPNPDNQLRPGQFVIARVTGAERLGAVLVPQSAVMQNPAGTSVYVVDDANQARMRPVEPGDWHGDHWIIDSGLQAGDRVILDHLLQIRPGMPIDGTVVSGLSTGDTDEPSAEAGGAPATSPTSAPATTPPATTPPATTPPATSPPTAPATSRATENG